SGLALRHRAVATTTRANITQDHEGGGAGVPAFANVGAMRVFANGVEFHVAHDSLQTMISIAAGKTRFNPLRKSWPILHRSILTQRTLSFYLCALCVKKTIGGGPSSCRSWPRENRRLSRGSRCPFGSHLPDKPQRKGRRKYKRRYLYQNAPD